MKIYKIKVNYYETDKMGVVHHSNYIRYFEEARTYFLEEIGFPYSKIEQEKIISPVTSVTCQYKKPALYGETLDIEIKLVGLSAVKSTFSYIVKNQNGEINATGQSEHCFLNDKGRIITIKSMPSFKEALDKELEEEN